MPPVTRSGSAGARVRVDVLCAWWMTCAGEDATERPRRRVACHQAAQYLTPESMTIADVLAEVRERLQCWADRVDVRVPDGWKPEAFDIYCTGATSAEFWQPEFFCMLPIEPDWDRLAHDFTPYMSLAGLTPLRDVLSLMALQRWGIWAYPQKLHVVVLCDRRCACPCCEFFRSRVG